METLSGLYIHTPFCETKCHYCDFFSLPEGKRSSEMRRKVYEAILSELDLHLANHSGTFETVFLGGGTPSLMPAEYHQAIFDRIKLSPNAEVTAEANPSSVTLEKAKAWRKAGINRISLGIQALNDDRLKWLGRVHGKVKAYRALDALFGAGFENISVDYIVGVPGQNTPTIEAELENLLWRFPKIQHISAYLLTLNKTNPKVKELPKESEQLRHLRTIKKTLARYGIEQYEISNFARRGMQARHNENYWLGGGYLGIGPSAHSYYPTENKRTRNVASLDGYVERISKNEIPLDWTEELNTEENRTEYLMLRLRRKEGLDLSTYRNHYEKDLLEEKAQVIDSLKEKGLCQISADRTKLRLTQDGFFLSDQIVSQLL